MVNFNHKFGCQKCEVAGEYHRDSHRMSFPDTKCTRRNNETFRSRAQQIHHKETSLIEELEIDMINSFPIADSLHLFDLGIMRKCMFRWAFGMKGYSRKWTKSLFDRTSISLEQCAPYMPTDIHRAVRGLNCLNRWKGLEFRTLLLYIGMVVLKPSLPTDEYNHFLLLSCAVTICSCKIYKKSIPMASKLFEKYVELYIGIYGRDTITSNVHNLIHVVEDMNNLQISNLSEISTYKYENCLRLLGLKIKHSHLPLQQAARRVIEASYLEHRISDTISSIPNVFNPRLCYGKERENSVAYDKIELKPDIMLSNRRIGDCWFLAKTNDAKFHIVKMIFATKDRDSYKIWGSQLKELKNYFNYPLKSYKLNIYVSDGETESATFWDIKLIVAKLICLPSGQDFVYIPILHTLEELYISE